LAVEIQSRSIQIPPAGEISGEEASTRLAASYLEVFVETVRLRGAVGRGIGRLATCDLRGPCISYMEGPRAIYGVEGHCRGQSVTRTGDRISRTGLACGNRPGVREPAWRSGAGQGDAGSRGNEAARAIRACRRRPHLRGLPRASRVFLGMLPLLGAVRPRGQRWSLVNSVGAVID
jgi:hypothetical protein